MNDLEKYFRENKGNLIHKWMHYFEIYDRYFKQYRNKEVTILEIGIYQGGSLQMWKDYFGPAAMIPLPPFGNRRARTAFFYA